MPLTIEDCQKGGKIQAIVQRERALAIYYENPKICETCKQIIGVKINESVSITRKKRFCSSSCSARSNNRKRKQKVKIQLPRRPHYWSMSGMVTKGALFGRRINWQSARSTIQNRARVTFKRSEIPKCCFVCGYDRYYEVAHKISVSSFGGNALISEINALDNLVALCPNHHIEYDKSGLAFVEWMGSGSAS